MDLKILGLSGYEEKVYKTLVRLGKSSSTEISRESEVPYGKIYVVLDSLEAKNLVKIIPEKTKKFIATNPENLIESLSKKEQELKALKEDLKDLKRIYHSKDEEVVKISRGKKNFYKLTRELIKAKKFSYTVRYAAEYNPEWFRKHKEFVKRGVKTKALVRYDEETKENIKKWLKVRKDFRKLDNKGVAMVIHESEVFIALIKSNVLLSIRDKPFISLMKKMYEETYKTSEKIT